MRLEGSCHCGAVTFLVKSRQPYPFCLCYCSICRKTAGGGDYATNLGADFETLKIKGAKHIRVYYGKMRTSSDRTEESPAGRSFCGLCGSALWVWDPRWPELVHPFASAIDTELPEPPERTHIMLGSKPSWVKICVDSQDKQFRLYPDEALAEWHVRLGLKR